MRGVLAHTNKKVSGKTMMWFRNNTISNKSKLETKWEVNIFKIKLNKLYGQQICKKIELKTKYK